MVTVADKHNKMDKINEVLTITLGALGILDVIGQGSLNVTQNGFVTSSTVLALLDGLTSGEGRGLMLGVANGDLSDTEIEEAIEAQGPFFRGQTPQSERTSRLVRFVGNVGPESHEVTPAIDEHFVWFDKFATRISFSEDKAAMLRWFVYNAGSSALTTGATLRLTIMHTVRWG